MPSIGVIDRLELGFAQLDQLKQRFEFGTELGRPNARWAVVARLRFVGIAG